MNPLKSVAFVHLLTTCCMNKHRFFSVLHRLPAVSGWRCDPTLTECIRSCSDTNLISKRKDGPTHRPALSFLSLLCCFTASSNLSFFRSLHPAALSGCSLASNSEGEAFDVCCDSHKPKLLDVPTAKIKPGQIAQFKLLTYPHHR